MKTMQRSLVKAWRPCLLVLTLGLIAYLLYFSRLGSLLPGYAAPESQAYQNSLGWHGLLSNPLNAPYKIIVLLLSITGHHQLVLLRVAAALCGLAAVVTFFFITRAWYSFRSAFLGTVLFATSSGLLHFARLGTPQILQMGVLMLIGAIVWHHRSPRWHPHLTYLVIAAFGILAYVPGLIWFELIIAVVVHRGILRHWNRSATPGRISWLGFGLLLLAPLALSMLAHPHLLFSWLGIPTDFGSLRNLPLNVIKTVLAIGVRSNGTALLWVGHSALLNAAELILGTLGVYYYVYQERSLRSLLLAFSGIGGVVLAALNGGVSIACVVPIAYLLVASGLNHFLGEWLAVFPRNPIARFTGVFVICVMLFFSVLYQVRSYFIAWPHNAETRRTFDIHRS